MVDPQDATADKPHWRRDFLGQLRFDSLVGRQLVVPEQYLLDGAFFITTPPRVLSQELGQPGRGDDADGLTVPIAFALRSPSFAESLGELLIDENSVNLREFMFKVIKSDFARRAVAHELGMRTRSDLEHHLQATGNVAEGVSRLLHDCAAARGVDAQANDDIAALEQGWAYWLEQEQNLAFEVYGRRDDRWRLPLLDNESLDPAVEGYDAVATQALAEVRARIQRASATRSAITLLLDGYRDVTEDRQTLDQLDEIEKWYSRARYRTIACQHSAHFVQLLNERRAVGPMQRLGERLTGFRESHEGNRIELPEELISGLAELDNTAWQRFVGAHRPSLTKWWREGHVDALKSVADDLSNLISPQRHTRTLFGMVLPDAAATTAVGAGTGVVASELGASGRVATAAGAGAAAAITVVLANTGSRKARRVQRRIMEAACSVAGPT